MQPVRNVALSLLEQAATGPLPNREYVKDSTSSNLRHKKRREETVHCVRDVLLSQVQSHRNDSVTRSSSLSWRGYTLWTTGER